VEEDAYEDEEHGLRTLFEHSEALSGSLRRVLQNGPGWRAPVRPYATRNQLKFSTRRPEKQPQKKLS
jgi:hypothetical protein